MEVHGGTGVPWVLAPSIEVCRDIRWGRCYESYGESPALVVEMAAAFIEGLQGEIDPSRSDTIPASDQRSVAACATLYGGAGGTECGTDDGTVELSLADMEAIHQPPAGAAVGSHVASVQVGNAEWGGGDVHGSEVLLTQQLRGRLNFSGPIVTAAMGIDALAKGSLPLAPRASASSPVPGWGYDYDACLEKAILAGVDMESVAARVGPAPLPWSPTSPQPRGVYPRHWLRQALINPGAR